MIRFGDDLVVQTFSLSFPIVNFHPTWKIRGKWPEPLFLFENVFRFIQREKLAENKLTDVWPPRSESTNFFVFENRYWQFRLRILLTFIFHPTWKLR